MCGVAVCFLSQIMVGQTDLPFRVFLPMHMQQRTEKSGRGVQCHKKSDSNISSLEDIDTLLIHNLEKYA